MQTENPTIELCEASMFAAIGKGTQLSASEFTVIFSPESRLHDRADLSGSLSYAVKQLSYAGIPLTDEQGLETYRAWRHEKDSKKAVEGARFIITAPFCEPYHGGSGSAGMFNRVVLVNGHGDWVGQIRVEQSEKWDSEVINNIRQKGAFVSFENREGILAALEILRKENPDYDHVPFPEGLFHPDDCVPLV